jgi:hypothetical protein
MRAILIEWYCWRNHKNDGAAKVCTECGVARVEARVQVHQSERAVVYRHPATGEHITPARADQPVPEVYARRGFERHEILRMADWEKQTGVCHEASNFHPGNEPVPDAARPLPGLSRERKESLVEDMRQAFASGPFTSTDDLE